MKKLFVGLMMAFFLIAMISCKEKDKDVDEVMEVTVTYETNGGNTIPLQKGKVATKIDYVEPTKTGYYFDGWYKDSSLTEAYSSWTFEDKNLTLYAKWVNYDTYLSKNMNGYIAGLMENTDGYVPCWNQEGFKGRWNYIDGVFLKSLLNCYDGYKEEYPDRAENYKNFIINYVNYYIKSDGTFVYYSPAKDYGYKSGELDSVCESQILFRLYEMTNDSRYITAAEYTYQQLMAHGRINESTDEYVNFEHKCVYANQVWLDGMYMYVPFYAQYAGYKNDPTIYSKIKAQYQFIRENMRDSVTGLYYHGYDASTGTKAFWAKSDGTSQSFWSRSTGWLIVSLVDSIEYFPEGEDKQYLIDMLQEAILSIMKYQDDSSKMFYQVIDKGGQSALVKASQFEACKNKKYQKNGQYVDAYVENYLEASGSSMIAYTLMKGARLNYLDDSYKNKGKEIYDGTVKHSMKVTFNQDINNYEINLNDICITAGLGDSKGEGRIIRDGSFAYYLSENVGSNDAKGVGPFIMAYTEYIK